MRGIGRRAERGAEAGGATAHGKTGTGHNAHAVRTAAILNLQPHVMDQATRRFDFSQLFIYYEMKRIITESHPPHSLTHSRHSLTHLTHSQCDTRRCQVGSETQADESQSPLESDDSRLTLHTCITNLKRKELRVFEGRGRPRESHI